MVGPYGTLRTLVSALYRPQGLTIGSLQPPRALEGLRRQGLAPDTLADGACDALLLRACRDHGDADALLNLRCRASQPIEQHLLHFHHRWGASHHLDWSGGSRLILRSAIERYRRALLGLPVGGQGYKDLAQKGPVS